MLKCFILSEKFNLNYNSFAYIITLFIINMAYDLFLYSILVNVTPVNKLYHFDWMILINTEYVYVYSVCVFGCWHACGLNILLYIRYHSFFPFVLLISSITIIQITIYFVFIVFLFYNPIIFSRIYIFVKFFFPSSLHFILLLCYDRTWFATVLHKCTYNSLLIFYI